MGILPGFRATRSEKYAGLAGSESTPLLSGMLKESGYATAHYGKWHLANNMIPDSLYQPSTDMMNTAFNCAGGADTGS